MIKKTFFSMVLAFVAVGLVFFSANTGLSEIAKDDIPPIIISGLNEYKTNGSEAALNAWIKGGPIEGSKEALSQAGNFKQVETFYGRYLDYHLIRVIKLTPTTKLIYLSMDFEKGPLFAVFMVYKINDHWIVAGRFNFHTDPNKILPDCLLGESTP